MGGILLVFTAMNTVKQNRKQMSTYNYCEPLDSIVSSGKQVPALPRVDKNMLQNHQLEWSHGLMGLRATRPNFLNV